MQARGIGDSSVDFGYQGEMGDESPRGITTRSGLILGAGNTQRPGSTDGAGDAHSHGYSAGLQQQHGGLQKDPHLLVGGGLPGVPLSQSLMQLGNGCLQLNIPTRGAETTGASSRTHVRPIDDVCTYT